MDIPMYAGDPNLIGGQACLDFTNTVGGRRPGYEREYLNSYADLVAWSQHASLVTATEAQQLIAEATRQPAKATRVIEQAILLREAIYRIFSAVAAGGSPEAADLTILNKVLAEALAHLQITPAGDGFSWTWRGKAEALDSMLWPIARSAGELLTSADLPRVNMCAGDNCGWLFLDTSRNRSRRWCDMRDCGNRAKARRHYRRSRTALTD